MIFAFFITKEIEVHAYPHQFVKTRFCRVWSNRDMSLFSLLAYFTSVCQGKSTKDPEKCSLIEESIWETIFHALGIVFKLFRGAFVHFLWWKHVFRDNFPIFPAFSICQNTFPSQKYGKCDGNLFWQIVIMPKAMGTRFQQWLLLYHIKSNFFVHFSSFWYLWASYEY